MGRERARVVGSTDGVPADRSAALRDMQGVTIPGEPTIETPAQRELFQRAQHQITRHVADLLKAQKPEPSTHPPRLRAWLRVLEQDEALHGGSAWTRDVEKVDLWPVNYYLKGEKKCAWDILTRYGRPLSGES